MQNPRLFDIDGRHYRFKNTEARHGRNTFPLPFGRRKELSANPGERDEA